MYSGSNPRPGICQANPVPLNCMSPSLKYVLESFVRLIMVSSYWVYKIHIWERQNFVRSPVEEAGHSPLSSQPGSVHLDWLVFCCLKPVPPKELPSHWEPWGCGADWLVDTVALRTKLAEYFPGEGTNKVPKPLSRGTSRREEAGTDRLMLIPERLWRG